MPLIGRLRAGGGDAERLLDLGHDARLGSKNFVFTAVQPPSLLMVKSVLGLGKLNLAATDGSTGR